MLRPRAVPLLVALAPIALAACGDDGDTVATGSVSTAADRPQVDARLDPDDIVITDEDLDGDGPASTDATTSSDADATAPDDGDDDPGGGGSGDADEADTDATGGDATGDGATGDAGTGERGDGDNGDGVDFTTSEDVPEDWPADVPAPTGLVEPASTVFEDAGEYTIVVTGVPTVEATAYVADYLDEVRSAGFETTSVVDDGEQIFSFAAEGAGWFLSAAASGVGGTEEIVVALTRQS